MAAASMTINRVGVRIGISLEYQVVVAAPSSLLSNAVLYKGLRRRWRIGWAGHQHQRAARCAVRIRLPDCVRLRPLEHRRSVEVGRVDVVVPHELLERPDPTRADVVGLGGRWLTRCQSTGSAEGLPRRGAQRVELYGGRSSLDSTAALRSRVH